MAYIYLVTVENLVAAVAAADQVKLQRTVQKNDPLPLPFKAIAAALGHTSWSAPQGKSTVQWNTDLSVLIMSIVFA